MSAKLGKIRKPTVEESKAGRKLYCIPLLFSTKEAPSDYVTLFNQYWDQVETHVSNLEMAGKPTKIYCEMTFSTGSNGLQEIKQQNERTLRFVKSRIKQGAILEPLEEEKLFSEYMDWGMCLSIVRSPDVVKKIMEFHRTAEESRDKCIAERINGTLQSNDAAILLMRDEDRIRIQPRFSSDISVFLVRPPTLNAIHRWIRDQAAKSVAAMKNQDTQEAQAP